MRTTKYYQTLKRHVWIWHLNGYKLEWKSSEKSIVQLISLRQHHFYEARTILDIIKLLLYEWATREQLKIFHLMPNHWKMILCMHALHNIASWCVGGIWNFTEWKVVTMQKMKEKKGGTNHLIIRWNCGFNTHIYELQATQTNCIFHLFVSLLLLFLLFLVAQPFIFIIFHEGSPFILLMWNKNRDAKQSRERVKKFNFQLYYLRT